MWSKGICWIDDCRIPFVDEKDSNDACKSDLDTGQSKGLWLFTKKNHKRTGGNTQGRFPANILVSDDMLNDGVVSKAGFNPNAAKKDYGGGKTFGGGITNNNNGYGDKGTNSRYYDIDKWFDNLIDV